MAKKKELSAIEMLDQVEQQVGEQQVEANGADKQQVATPTEIPKPNPPKEVEPVDVGEAILSLPCAESPRERANRYLNLSLTSRQSLALDQIREGADKSQARLRSGRRVVDTVGAVRYILEQVADSIGIPDIASFPAISDSPSLYQQSRTPKPITTTPSGSLDPRKGNNE